MAQPRRSISRLTQAIETASSDSQRAVAEYDLALFHDNNSREAAAIPHYENALSLGLRDTETRAKCLAFLASSLHKTGRHDEARNRASAALEHTRDEDLRSFVEGLLQRIERGPRQ